jgi:hypothetical protein
LDEQDDMMIEQIAHFLRDEPMRRPTPSFDAKVMAAIRWQGRPSAARAVLNWMTRPRSISLSPVGALACAAAFGGIAYLGAGAAVSRSVAPQEAVSPLAAATAASATQEQVASTAPQMVQFLLVAPEARSVSLVGDFNDWNATATPLGSSSGNVWTVEIPLAPGRYKYIFMVDGITMVPDPAAPTAPADALGLTNSVVTVGGSAS